MAHKMVTKLIAKMTAEMAAKMATIAQNTFPLAIKLLFASNMLEICNI